MLSSIIACGSPANHLTFSDYVALRPRAPRMTTEADTTRKFLLARMFLRFERNPAAPKILRDG
jgi:hypothetical protein